MNTNFERTQSIVETLRADIDFELDDVIAKIVQGLPDDYFVSLSPADQLKPLKGLLALGICQLDDEILMRSEVGDKVAVVANRNYPGQLANILKRLPDDYSLTGAKIFTSKEHDFIIDVFDFQSTLVQPDCVIAIDHLVEEVSEIVGRTQEEIREFVSHYPPQSPILSSAKQVAEQFMAYDEIEQATDTAIRWIKSQTSDRTRITVSAGNATARDLLQCTAEFLGDRQLDIEQAWLHDIPLDPTTDTHVAIVSFQVDGDVPEKIDAFKAFLLDRLG